MQFDNLENETTTELINRLKYDLEKFKTLMNKLIQKVENQFQEIICKITMSKKLFLQILQTDQNFLLSDDFFNNLTQQIFIPIIQQQRQLIINKLSNRIKYWQSYTTTMFDIKIDRILRINEVASFNEKFICDSLTLLSNKMIKLKMNKLYYCFALFDQRVNCNTIQHFLFKIQAFMRNVGIGLANLKVIKSNQYKSKLDNDNHGAYLCLADQTIMHHADPTKNQQKIGIAMGVGDIIEVTFNPFEKSITWKNLMNNQQYSTVIDNIDQELRGCVAMKFRDTIVQISDDELMIE